MTWEIVKIRWYTRLWWFVRRCWDFIRTGNWYSAGGVQRHHRTKAMSELTQFDGRTVAVIAPEDLEALEADNERLLGLLRKIDGILKSGLSASHQRLQIALLIEGAALAGAADQPDAAPRVKRAYYETHEPPHCPSCRCGLDRHPGYVIGNHWLESAYERICAGEAEAEVLADYGVTRTADNSPAGQEG